MQEAAIKFGREYVYTGDFNVPCYLLHLLTDTDHAQPCPGNAIFHSNPN
jgi:hypothetical protein